MRISQDNPVLWSKNGFGLISEAIFALLQSGTVKEINGKSGRSFLNALLAGEKIDLATLTEMRRDKRTASDLKAADEQLADDLNGVLRAIQKKMLLTMLAHIDEPAGHMKEPDNELDRERGELSLLQRLTGAVSQEYLPHY